MPTAPCSFPGCDHGGPFYEGHLCRAHRRIPGISPTRGIYCQMCGFGPRVLLAAHVTTFHSDDGGTAAYRRRFGYHSLSSADFRANQAAQYVDQRDEGTIVTTRRRKVCAKGHRLTAANVLVKNMTVRGKTIPCRLCRKCYAERHREWVARKRWRNRPAWRRRQRSCHWCGGRYWPAHSAQRFCCTEHKIAERNRRRRALYRLAHPAT